MLQLCWHSSCWQRKGAADNPDSILSSKQSMQCYVQQVFTSSRACIHKGSKAQQCQPHGWFVELACCHSCRRGRCCQVYFVRLWGSALNTVLSICKSYEGKSSKCFGQVADTSASLVCGGNCMTTVGTAPAREFRRLHALQTTLACAML
jgi:hypothetical protein